MHNVCNTPSICSGSSLFSQAHQYQYFEFIRYLNHSALVVQTLHLYGYDWNTDEKAVKSQAIPLVGSVQDICSIGHIFVRFNDLEDVFT